MTDGVRSQRGESLQAQTKFADSLVKDPILHSKPRSSEAFVFRPLEFRKWCAHAVLGESLLWRVGLLGLGHAHGETNWALPVLFLQS